MASAEELHEVDCAVFVALKEEFAPLLSRIEQPQPDRCASARYTIGLLGTRRVAICRTGIGKKNATRRCRALVGRLRPRRILVTGFAGGLAPTWTTGDCVVAAKVTDVPARSIEGAPESPPPVETGLRSWEAPEDMLRRTLSLTFDHRVRAGHLISVERVLRTRAEKAGVGAALDAHAVDMESSGILSVAAAERIPALCVRVILDDQDFELPFDFGKIMTPEGEVGVKTLVAIGTQPHKWSRLAELRQRTISAARVLEAVVPRIVSALEPA